MTIQAAEESRQMHRYGIYLILLSAVFFTFMSLGVRMLRETFQAHSLVFYRSLFQMLVLLPLAREFLDRRSLPAKVRTHGLRGIFGIASMFFLYIALGHLPLGLANLLAMTSVIWAALLARLLYEERMTPREAVASLASVVGVALTLLGADQRGPSWTWDLTGVITGLLCGLFMGAALTVLRNMRKAMGSVEIVFFFGACGVALTLPLMIARPELPRDLYEWMCLLFVSAMATTGQMFMTAGFRYTSTTVGTVTKLVEPLLNLAVGFFALREIPPGSFIFGALLVVVGVGLLITARRREVYNSNTVGV